MNNYFIILASGQSKRFNSKKPKQFNIYKNKALFKHSLEKAMKSIDEHYELSEVANKSVMKPPKEGSGKKSRVLPEYRAYIYSNITSSAEPWINPHLHRVAQLCINDGVSPYWEKAYS